MVAVRILRLSAIRCEFQEPSRQLRYISIQKTFGTPGAARLGVHYRRCNCLSLVCAEPAGEAPPSSASAVPCPRDLAGHFPPVRGCPCLPRSQNRDQFLQVQKRRKAHSVSRRDQLCDSELHPHCQPHLSPLKIELQSEFPAPPTPTAQSFHAGRR